MRILTGILLLCLLSAAPLAAQNAADVTDTALRSPRFGITFISSAQAPADALRYRHALGLGAGWNRFPIYWEQVETAPRQYDWRAYDRVVQDDLQHGLNVNAILIGIPAFYRDGERISGLHTAMFSDGTDTWAEGKTPNPENAWARFVWDTVRRYRPGGLLAGLRGWDAGQGVRVWEIWNEPDYRAFWSASIGDYARLLKTAYVVIHAADPDATVMFGGLIFNAPGGDNWLARVLAIFENDPLREENNWYMDAVAVHNYNYAWRTGWLVRWVRETLRAYRLERPIWVNESGAPVWDDYPGPTWARTPDDHLLRVTMEHQAWFFIQSTAWAFAEGASVVFWHQLYDDCGNQPPGTTFPPNDPPNAGDAFGIFRNEPYSVCFNQHPQPGSPRPVAQAYRLMAELFGTGDWSPPTLALLGDGDTFDGTPGDSVMGRAGVVVRFERPDARVYVLWSSDDRALRVQIPADGAPQARLLSLARDWTLTPGADGTFTVRLPAAVPDGFPFLNPGEVSGVGGAPRILIVPKD